jgi:F420-non-reducing hydrogenase small subunit
LPARGRAHWDAITAILRASSAAASVIGANTTVCDVGAQTEREEDQDFKRTWQIIPDPEICLLEQGLLCCGLATGPVAAPFARR